MTPPTPAASALLAASRPTTKKLEFTNAEGVTLAARLEEPAGEALATAIFAHCFTCSKDSHAATRISRALGSLGIAVLRFDFTGLGGSDGDFANTDFSSNVADLVAAADFLRSEGRAPSLLVGHSLGGAAVLMAAGAIPEVRAVATIGAPSDPGHVEHLLRDEVEGIRERGKACVDLAGRKFEIRKEFLEDLEGQRFGERLRELRAAVLVAHSPLDEIVGIDHARELYLGLRTSKSFLSLDDADHLLSRAADAEYAAGVIAAWARRYVETAAPASAADPAEGVVRVTETGPKYRNEVALGPHRLVADEPRPLSHDAGPTPYGYLLAGLGTCTSMTLRMYADRKEIPLQGVSVELAYRREQRPGADGKDERFHVIERELKLEGPLTEAQRERLLEIADRCPVHRTLTEDKRIDTRLA